MPSTTYGADRDRLLNENEIAEWLGVSVKTLRNKRVNGSAIPFIKIGRIVRYRESDVLAHIAANRFESTSEFPVTSPPASKSRDEGRVAKRGGRPRRPRKDAPDKSEDPLPG